MKVSQQKTQIITPENTEVWIISNVNDNEHFEIKAVEQYPYLGIEQCSSVAQTSDKRSTAAINKIRNYRKLMNMKKFHVADTLESYIVSWRSVLLPSVLYGSEVMPWTVRQINELEIEQNKFAKSVMSIQHSTANVCVQALLGMKQIRQLILESRIRMIKKAREAELGSILRTIWDFMSDNNQNLLWKRLKELTTEESIKTPIHELSVRDITIHFERKMRRSMIEMKTMNWLTIPRSPWKMKKFMLDSEWARTYVQFLTQNAGLGNNRTNKLSNYAISNEAGRIIFCPLCGKGYNNELHLVLKCEKLTGVRRDHQMRDNSTVQAWIEDRRNQDDDKIMREFFGGLQQDLPFYIDRGLYLITLRRKFFQLWSEKCGENVECTLE